PRSCAGCRETDTAGVHNCTPAALVAPQDRVCHMEREVGRVVCRETTSGREPSAWHSGRASDPVDAPRRCLVRLGTAYGVIRFDETPTTQGFGLPLLAALAVAAAAVSVAAAPRFENPARQSPPPLSGIGVPGSRGRATRL